MVQSFSSHFMFVRFLFSIPEKWMAECECPFVFNSLTHLFGYLKSPVRWCATHPHLVFSSCISTRTSPAMKRTRRVQCGLWEWVLAQDSWVNKIPNTRQNVVWCLRSLISAGTADAKCKKYENESKKNNSHTNTAITAKVLVQWRTGRCRKKCVQELQKIARIQ